MLILLGQAVYILAGTVLGIFAARDIAEDML